MVWNINICWPYIGGTFNIIRSWNVKQMMAIDDIYVYIYNYIYMHIWRDWLMNRMSQTLRQTDLPGFMGCVFTSCSQRGSSGDASGLMKNWSSWEKTMGTFHQATWIWNMAFQRWLSSEFLRLSMFLDGRVGSITRQRKICVFVNKHGNWSRQSGQLGDWSMR